MAEKYKKIVLNDFPNNTAESGIISIGEIVPIQLILKHAPIVGGVGYGISVKYNQGAAYEAGHIIETTNDGEYRKVYNFPQGLKKTFIQFKLDTANTVSKNSPELVLVYVPSDMEAAASQSNAPAFTFDITGTINPIIASGVFIFRGAYDNAVDYAVGDTVSYLGSSYTLYADVGAGTLPTDTTKWQLLAQQGIKGTQGVQGVPGAVNWDGGAANSIYLINQILDCGSA